MTKLTINRTDDEPYLPEFDMVCQGTLIGPETRNFGRALTKQLLDSVWTDDKNALEQAEALMGAVEAWRAMEARDPQEAMLALQMIRVHNAAMACLQRAALESTPPHMRESLLNQAMKLGDRYLHQVAALDKHRGKGQQRITVERVAVVQAGGQAIVGNVEAPSSIDAVPLSRVGSAAVPPIRCRSRTRRQ